MAQVHTLPKYGRYLIFVDCTVEIENAAQMMTVSELFIYRSVNMESQGYMCYCACLGIIITYFGAKHRICAAKFWVNRNLLNTQIYWYFKLCLPLRQCILYEEKTVSFITAVWLWRQIFHTHSKSGMWSSYRVHISFFFLMNTQTYTKWFS